MRYLTIFLLTLVFVLSSCGASKKKKREELSGTGEVFENTTAKFNGYFNAKELWNESLLQMQTQYKDNFNQILPIFSHTASDDAASYNDNMDKCIEKLATVITKHPASDWTDDSYMLLGKSYFLKQEYEEALGTFEFINSKYPPSHLEKIENAKIKKPKKKKKKKKKKKEIKPKKNKTLKYSSINQYKVYDGRIVDKIPAFYENLLWMAHSYMTQDQFIYAELALDRFEKYKDLPNRIKRDLHPVRAKWHLLQEDFPSTVSSLRKAIDMSNDNLVKARYSFIIGQLETRLKNYSEAAIAYSDCIKYKPIYEMVFAAQLKKIQLDAIQNADPEKIKRDLDRMLADGKNKEYSDQIYFTMARLAYEKGDLAEAEKYYKKSVQFSQGDQTQLAESYYYLADMNYNRQDYLQAKYYYDSTLMNMNKNDHRFFEVESYSENLKDIALNLETIILNDSLLRMVGLSQEERRDFAYELQKQQEESRKRPKKPGLSGLGSSKSFAAASTGSSRGGKQSTYFAYDEKTKKKALRQFEKVWGNINNDDLWRFSSLTNAVNFEEEETESYESLVLTDEDVTRLTAFIPDEPEKQETLKSEIIEAKYQLGILYRDRLEQLNKSNESFLSLLKEYPNSPRELDAYFYLYLNYIDQNNTERAEHYKSLIINNYGETNYAKALIDPSLLALTLDPEQQVKNHYDECFALFEDGQTKDCLVRIKTRKELFPDNRTYESKYDLLSAMCIGRLEGRDSYISNLREVLARHKGSPEANRAKEILDVLGLYGSIKPKKSNDSTKVSSTDVIDHNFKYKPEESHNVIIIYDGKNLSNNDAKVGISNFNNKFFRLDKLKVSNIFMNTTGDNPMVVVRKFKDAKKAEAYCQVVIEKKDEIFGGKAITPYPISQGNYRELLKIKSLPTYEEFFRESYVK